VISADSRLSFISPMDVTMRVIGLFIQVKFVEGCVEDYCGICLAKGEKGLSFVFVQYALVQGRCISTF
jgi:hypothetical protein